MKKTKDEKLQYNINKETAKISALSSAKNDQFEYLSVEEILPLDKIGIAVKPIWNQGRKQVKVLKVLKTLNPKFFEKIFQI